MATAEDKHLYITVKGMAHPIQIFRLDDKFVIRPQGMIVSAADLYTQLAATPQFEVQMVGTPYAAIKYQVEPDFPRATLPWGIWMSF